ncbi:carbon-nitrogen hydrolase family protein [Pseudomonas panipatensis]|uniref:Predicted amidohydrolase n=1 Tax=Pseudomonas panipatensis TaxID=428992 RepID=A0A1G8M1H0_9PSED|nr:carbon-nitrogen hydrolase family protein [Pseudomonas panipatensis]SDI61778.1 Predicted amidohydrolase [Pseudomonas panipatensis]SMP48248.1 Predicted amidohydrolase [Pseudomonas panipatensis]
MQLAIWQTQGFPADPAANLAALERQLASVAGVGGELLLCPELWLCGYQVPAQMAALAEAADGPAARRIAELARQYGVAVCYGYAERHAEGGKPYNSAQFIDASGQRLANYRKTHLFGAMERELFTPGERLETPFRFGDWTLGLLICFDVEYPEAVRHQALGGADLLLIPTALTPEYGAVPQLIVPARAVENQLFVAYCNHCGEENGLAYLGGSRVVGPDGEALAAAGAAECLLLVRLDRARRAALADCFPYLPGRRPQLYAALVQG